MLSASPEDLFSSVGHGILDAMPNSWDVLFSIGPFVGGYLIGWVAPKAHRWRRTRRTRKFWKPFSKRDQVSVIMGGDRSFPTFEASGLVGVGDVMALTELQAIFDENRLGRLPITLATSPREAHLETADLILIGGPDMNWATKAVASRLPARFTFGNPDDREIQIKDQKTGTVYRPSDPGERDIHDVGLIKLVPNPFDTRRKVLLIAGAFGHATFAGVKLTGQKDFLKHPLIAAGSLFECLFSVDIVANEPLAPTIIDVVPFLTSD
jgi:hypothetical protein